jgi:hypothetical protein
MRLLISAALVSLLSACSTTLDFHGQTTNYLTPEAPGKTLGISAQLEYGNSSKFILGTLEQSNIFSSQINVNTDQALAKDQVLSGQIGVGILENFEVYIRSVSDAPDLIMLKAQLWGDPALTASEGLKIAIAAGVGSGEDKDTISASNGSGTTRTYQSDMENEVREVGASLGWRFNKTVLVFLSPFYRNYDVSAVLTSDTFPRTEIKGKGIVRGSSLGAQFNSESAYLIVQAGYAHSKWSTEYRRDDLTLGGAIGIHSW